MMAFSTLANGPTGEQVIQKLATVCASYGGIYIRNALFNILTSYIYTRGSIVTLLTSGVNPECYVNRKSLCVPIPLANALLLVSSTNCKAVLIKIEADSSSDMKSISGKQSWIEYRTLLHMLSMCGHRLQLHVMDYLHSNHASTYIWIHEYLRNPRPLSHLCRQVIRTQLKPNIIAATKQLYVLPETLRKFLLLQV